LSVGTISTTRFQGCCGSGTSFGNGKVAGPCSFIDTLSAGYAEAGEFDNAVTQAERALALAPRENQEKVLENIKRFRAREPVHLNN